jgi:hypothetical protein
MTTIEQQQPTLEQARQAAEVALHDAQAETAAAKVVVAELQSKLEAERNFRASLRQRFDGACAAEQDDDAQQLQAEISKSDIKAHGLELRLQTATQERTGCEAAEQPLATELNRLLQLEAVEAERVALTKMIMAVDESYDSLIRVAERLEQSLLALKNKQWIDPQHAGTANDALFRITSHLRGFNYGNKT